MLSSICPNIEVVFHFLKIELVFNFPKIEVVFHFQKDWGRLPFSNKLRSSSISKKIEVIFRFESYFTPVWLLGQVLLISSYFTTSPGGRPGGRAAGRAAGRMLDIAKLKLNSASLVELGLGPSLAKWYFPSQVAVVIYMVIWPWQIPLKVISYALTWTYLKLKVESLHCKTFGFSDYKMVRENEDVLKNYTPPSVKYSQILSGLKHKLSDIFSELAFLTKPGNLELQFHHF